MAFVVKDRVKESSSTTGTGSLTLSGAASNYQTFNTAIGVGNFCWYCVNHLSANEWEVGYGQLTGATTFARTSVLASTNSNALVSFSAGTKEVFVTQPAAFNNQTLGRTNIIINPHGSILQEGGAAVTTDGAYFADQWFARFNAATAAFQSGASTGLGVSAYDPYGFFLKTTTAKGALAAGDFALMQQYIEGSYSRRLLYGGGSAKGSWLRFRASCSQSATCSVAITNGGATRSWVQSFAVTTTPTDFAFFVPGDTTGTWPTDTSRAARVAFCHSAGTTFQTSTLGAWQAGEFVAANTQTNLLATLNAQLNVSDVQWSQSDVLLPFEPVDYVQELLKCQRYYYQSSPGSGVATGWTGQAVSTTQAVISFRHPVQMRVPPPISVTGMGVTNAGAGVLTVTSGTINTMTEYGGTITINVSAGLVGGNACWFTGAGTVTFNARM